MGDLIASSGSRTERIEAGVRGQVGEEDVTTALIKMTRDKFENGLLPDRTR